ncbi:uncharacterized protein [Hetaerina americana]|uniref:uncharacterized protein n=1 Tax=Hetaerina americana TaxID=62018 RepID=UPI003A7F4B09
MSQPPPPAAESSPSSHPPSLQQLGEFLLFRDSAEPVNPEEWVTDSDTVSDTTCSVSVQDSEPENLQDSDYDSDSDHELEPSAWRIPGPLGDIHRPEPRDPIAYKPEEEGLPDDDTEAPAAAEPGPEEESEDEYFPTAGKFDYQCLSTRDTLRFGANLPMPQGAPHVFIPTRPTALIDQYIKKLVNRCILTIGRATNAFPLIAIPKAGGGVRVIQDLSAWTGFIRTPRFTLKSAAQALESIPPGSLLIKIDLKDAFWQVPIEPSHRHNYGVYHQGATYTWTRLPMGHALAPAIMQRWARAVIHEVYRKFEIVMIAYLDDWLLLFDNSTEHLILEVVDFLRQELQIHINDKKSRLTPVTRIKYLGVKIDTVAMTLSLTKHSLRRIEYITQVIKRIRNRDVPKATGFISWCVYVLRLPLFLITQTAQRDTTWLARLWEDGTWHAPREFTNYHYVLDVYADATPWQVAWTIPMLRTTEIWALEEERQILEAEGLAALMAAHHAISVTEPDTMINVYTDNMSVMSTVNLMGGRIKRLRAREKPIIVDDETRASDVRDH